MLCCTLVATMGLIWSSRSSTVAILNVGEACRRLGLGWWEVLMALGCLCKLMWLERAVALGVNRGGWVGSVLGVVGNCFQSSSWFGAAVLLELMTPVLPFGELPELSSEVLR